MNIHVSGVLGVVILLLTIASGLAGASGYYKAASAKSRIEARDDDIAAWESRYTALEGDLEREKLTRANVGAELATANQRIQNLADVVKAQDTLRDIAQTIEVANSRSRNMQTMLAEIARKVGIQVD